MKRSGVYAIIRPAASSPWSMAVWRFATERADTLFSFEKEPGNGISVSPDERFVLASQREHTVIDLMMLDEIPNELFSQH